MNRERPRELFVSGLPYHLSNEKLSHYFASFGQISKFTRPTDRRTGRNGSFAFLSYRDVNIFETVRTHDNHMVEGMKFDVRLSMTKEEMKNKRKEEGRGLVEVNQETIKKRYFKPNMIQDPWENCKPVQIDKNKQRRDQNIRHRGRLFMRTEETTHTDRRQAHPSPPYKSRSNFTQESKPVSGTRETNNAPSPLAHSSRIIEKEHKVKPAMMETDIAKETTQSNCIDNNDNRETELPKNDKWQDASIQKHCQTDSNESEETNRDVRPILSDITSPVRKSPTPVHQKEDSHQIRNTSETDHCSNIDEIKPKPELSDLSEKKSEAMIIHEPEPTSETLPELRIPINGVEISSMFQSLYCQDPPDNSKDDFSTSSGVIKLENFVGEGLIEYFVRIFTKSTKQELSFCDVNPSHLKSFEKLSNQFELTLYQSTVESTGQHVIILKKVT